MPAVDHDRTGGIADRRREHEGATGQGEPAAAQVDAEQQDQPEQAEDDASNARPALRSLIRGVAVGQQRDEQRLGAHEDASQPWSKVLLAVGEQQQRHRGLDEYGLDDRAGSFP
jgi:hypothetical protein